MQRKNAETNTVRGAAGLAKMSRIFACLDVVW